MVLFSYWATCEMLVFSSCTLNPYVFRPLNTVTYDQCMPDLMLPSELYSRAAAGILPRENCSNTQKFCEITAVVMGMGIVLTGVLQ